MTLTPVVCVWSGISRWLSGPSSSVLFHVFSLFLDLRLLDAGREERDEPVRRIEDVDVVCFGEDIREEPDYVTGNSAEDVGEEQRP